ncbi:hypothetical protein D1872_130070 [compost metagenome]
MAIADDAMTQQERDEISDSFSEAWRQSFGLQMFYVPFLKDESNPHPLYRESKGKKYDFANKLLFYGTYKQKPIEEIGEIGGRELRETGEITFVTKELHDKGLRDIDPSAIIQFFDKYDNEQLFEIVGKNAKVQFITDWIFTKLKVVRADDKRIIRELGSN